MGDNLDLKKEIKVKSETNKIRFLQSAIKKGGKKVRVRYSKGSYTKESGLPEGTITIYAKDYGNQLPQELKPINETELMTDYFETDRARIIPSNKYYKDVEKALKKQQAFNDKLIQKRRKKYGY